MSWVPQHTSMCHKAPRGRGRIFRFDRGRDISRVQTSPYFDGLKRAPKLETKPIFRDSKSSLIGTACAPILSVRFRYIIIVISVCIMSPLYRAEFLSKIN